MTSARRYFDHAATSFPKPEAVLEAMNRYQRHGGAPAGRGGYRAALQAGRIVDECRTLAANVLGVAEPNRIAFTFNGTDGLNIALLGLCRPGDHVITSAWEHNSVLRPLRHLQDHRGVAVTRLEPNANGQIVPESVAAALTPTTRLVAVQHASNVIGVVQPVESIAEVVRAHGALFLVDAAQTAGHRPIAIESSPIDLWACSGHKGLRGPLGTGLLYVGPRAESELQPLRWGGTGTHSEDDRQPAELPERLESGNLNVLGLAGLGAALHELAVCDLYARGHLESQRVQQLWDALSRLPKVTLYGRSPCEVDRLGVVSLNIAGYAPQELATILDDHFGIEARVGLHCAPGVHRTLGTVSAGGTLRLSLGPETSEDDLDAVIEAITALSS